MLENTIKISHSTGKIGLNSSMSKIELILVCMPLYGQDSAHSEPILALLPTVCPTDMAVQVCHGSVGVMNIRPYPSWFDAY